MYTSTFIFQGDLYDDDFHRLNNQTAEQARAIPGFLGEESWDNERTHLSCEVYYWESLEALHQLVGMTEHTVAKREHARWISAYRVVISEVQTTYGQPGLGLEHVPRLATDGA